MGSTSLLGTKGKLIAERFYTPHPGFNPTLQLEHQNKIKRLLLPADNHFLNMLYFFVRCINGNMKYESCYQEILDQSRLLDQVILNGDYSDGSKI